jgi:dipeptidyl aminopeptidase/acylaminoacyl peptidase
MKRRLSLAAAGCALLVTMSSTRAAEKRFITESDLLKFTWIADPQISPDGSTVAFVRVTVNEKEHRYETALFIVPTSGSEAPRRLTADIRDTSPRWSPDGRQLAFIRSMAKPRGEGEQDGKPQPQPGQIYLLAMDGGEARPLTDLPHGAGTPVWSSDGKTIAFSAPVDDRKGQVGRDGRDRQDGKDAKEGNDQKSDVRVITRAVYRANGNPTYVESERHSHIFTVAVPAGATNRPEPKQITSGEFDERDLAWSRDSSTIYFTSNRLPEAYYEPDDSDLYSMPAGGGAMTKVASIEGSIRDLAVSPDGKRIAFVGTLHGNPVRSYSQPDLWVTDSAPGSTPKNLTGSYDFDISSGIGGDQAAPRGQNSTPIIWSPDGSSLIVVAAEHGNANLRRVTIASGKVEPITEGQQAIVACSATPDASTIATTISTQTTIGDLAVLDGARRLRAEGANRERAEAGGVQPAIKPALLTHLNENLFKDLTQSEPEEIWYTSFDGRRIQGWILKPPDFESGRKYPMILEIHGGPHSAYGNTFTHEFQWMAARGYVVLFTNPRGSTSYGQEFGNIIQYHYPGDDYNDLMAGVDEVLKRGYVDPNRLGVTGGSGGGLLTNWTITQTRRFKAAVAQRDIADWYGFWFTADFTLFQPTWFRKAPWEDPQDFAARSPITHVANVTTPLMLVLGDADYRTPPADGGEMMFRALKYRKIPTVMVRFPRETHELSRSGEPQHRVERLQHIVGWMDQWLQGKKRAEYTTQ